MPKPETKEVKLRRDSIDAILDLLEAGPRGSIEVPYERRQAIENKIREQVEKPVAIGLCGLPGAGKTTAAEILADEYDAQVVSMGDAIREHAPERFDSEELANFASQTRKRNPMTIPRWTTELVDDDERLVVIEGVRSFNDYRFLNDHFSEFYLMEVWAHFYDRLWRLVDRARENEENFNAVDLVKRDEQERNELGFGELKDNVDFDARIKNNDTEDCLRKSIKRTYRSVGVSP